MGSPMDNHLARYFGKIRRHDANHADDGFYITADGEKIRIERRLVRDRRLRQRRAAVRSDTVDRRIKGMDRRLGIDWRVWVP